MEWNLCDDADRVWLDRLLGLRLYEMSVEQRVYSIWLLKRVNEAKGATPTEIGQSQKKKSHKRIVFVAQVFHFNHKAHLVRGIKRDLTQIQPKPLQNDDLLRRAHRAVTTIQWPPFPFSPRTLHIIYIYINKYITILWIARVRCQALSTLI